MIAYLLQGLVLGFPAAAQPGSMQAYLLAQTLKNGWRRTLPLFLAMLQIVGGCFLLYLAWGARKGMKTAVTTPPSPDSAPKGLFKAALLNALNPNPYIFWATIAGPILLTGLRESVWHGLVFMFGFYATLAGCRRSLTLSFWTLISQINTDFRVLLSVESMQSVSQISFSDSLLVGGFAAFVGLLSLTGKLSSRANRGLSGAEAVALGLFGVYQLWKGISVTKTHNPQT